MKIAQAGLSVLVFLIFIIANSAFYVVDETEQTILLEFGRPIGKTVTEAGLHMKVPFIQDVQRFEKRILEWDGDQNQIPTEDKRFILVDNFARWRIKDPLLFYQSVINETGAQSRLDDIIDGVTRDIITQSRLIEVVRTSNRIMMATGENESGVVEIKDIEQVKRGRKEIARDILKKANEIAPKYGIEIVDVQLKHINYIESVRQKVYERMISERLRIAEKFRSEGQGERARIDGQREKDLQAIESEAYRKAQEIIGKADAEAISIYAESFGRDPEFYSFVKSLDTYKKTLKDNSTLILKTDSDYLRYIKRQTR